MVIAAFLAPLVEGGVPRGGILLGDRSRAEAVASDRTHPLLPPAHFTLCVSARTSDFGLAVHSKRGGEAAKEA